MPSKKHGNFEISGIPPYPLFFIPHHRDNSILSITTSGHTANGNYYIHLFRLRFLILPWELATVGMEVKL
jgi:hypothetical protein